MLIEIRFNEHFYYKNNKVKAKIKRMKNYINIDSNFLLNIGKEPNSRFSLILIFALNTSN